MSCDLHCHTKLSDGSVGIEELIALAKRRGLKTIAITDHDTFAGAVRGVNIGRRQGVEVLPGAELSAVDPATGRKVHVLCYNCAAPARLEGLCHRTLENRKKVATERLRRVLRYYPLPPEMVVRCATGSAAVYIPHIMHALVDAGYADGLFGEVHERLFGSKGVANVPEELPDVREVIDLIHSAEGLAVLAHPFVFKSTDLMEQLVKEGRLDGIEAVHPKQNESQQAQLTDFAKQHRLLVTGGSDFHGMYSRKVHAVGSTTVPDELAEELLKYKRVEV